jgi:hypothetical protein
MGPIHPLINAPSPCMALNPLPKLAKRPSDCMVKKSKLSPNRLAFPQNSLMSKHGSSGRRA